MIIETSLLTCRFAFSCSLLARLTLYWTWRGSRLRLGCERAHTLPLKAEARRFETKGVVACALRFMRVGMGIVARDVDTVALSSHASPFSPHSSLLCSDCASAPTMCTGNEFMSVHNVLTKQMLWFELLSTKHTSHFLP